MVSSTKSGYRGLLTREFLVWAVVSPASKAPVAMTPLALVFLSRESPGGYTLGATLASVYVLGEVVGAPLLGTRLSRGRLRGQLSAGLLVGALAFGALPVAHSAPAPVLIVLAFVAGAAPAACPGGIRSVLTRMVADDMVPRALSAEATLTQIVWAAAPGLVVLLALQVHPGAPLVLGALLAATASILVLRLPEPQPREPAERTAAPTTRTLLSGWPVYLTSAAAMAMLATAELVLPAVLEDQQLSVSWSGPLLAGFALTSAVGAFCYGLRTWPGSVRTQSLVFLAVTAACVSLITLLPGLPGIAVALLLAGVFQSGVMVTRNLSLRERLPEPAHAAAYSVMYAVQGLGYSLTASLTAVALDLASPSAAILGGVTITLLITVVSAIAERGSVPPPTTAEPLTLADADDGP
ncbi:MFS transporter [Streptomyces sp. NPDC056161]|uniref:MFS transporter n=1 Tax=Streptomyces sp. NPDC056161 TaxID=3345732 RepID=UPI0035D75E5F